MQLSTGSARVIYFALFAVLLIVKCDRDVGGPVKGFERVAQVVKFAQSDEEHDVFEADGLIVVGQAVFVGS